jgi:hypothetical protein
MSKTQTLSSFTHTSDLKQQPGTSWRQRQKQKHYKTNSKTSKFSTSNSPIKLQKRKPNRNSNQCSTMGQNQNLFENPRDWRREIWRVKKISNGKQSMSRSILSSHQESTKENLMLYVLLL